jgi:two-component system, cell cycle response regulator CtrA
MAYPLSFHCQENDALRARVSDLEREIGLAAWPPPMFGLTKTESVMFGVPLNTACPCKETLMTALFSDRIDDPLEIKIIDVWICKMRQKLKPFGIEINTACGVGYQMPEASKAQYCNTRKMD